jgi:hypothetical protein
VDSQAGFLREPAAETWNAGAGFEWIVICFDATTPKEIDFSLRAEFNWYANRLGIDLEDFPLELLVALGLGAEDLPRNRRVGRNVFWIGGTISF